MNIGEMADHCLGKMLDKSKNRGTPRPYLRNLNVRWFSFDLSDMLEMKFEDSESDRYSLRRGDVAVCEGGYPGRAAIWDNEEPIYVQKAIHKVRFHEPERAKWFVYYLSYCDAAGTLKDHFSGSGIQHFTGQALAKFRLPVPPLEEQQRIVAVLDEAFEGLNRARANAEANLASAQELFENGLATTFRSGRDGWHKASIGDLCTLKSGTTVDKSLEKASGDIPYVKVAEMNLLENLEGIQTSIRFLDASDVSSSQIIPAGATIFPKRGGAILTNKKRRVLRPICADLNVMSVIPGEKIHKEFLYYFFMSVDMRDLGSGTSVPQINNYDIAPLVLSYPDNLADQIMVVDELKVLESACNQLKIDYQRQLVELAHLRQSLLQQAFAGELT